MEADINLMPYHITCVCMHCSCNKSRIHLNNLYGHHRYETLITAACLALTSRVHCWHVHIWQRIKMTFGM